MKKAKRYERAKKVKVCNNLSEKYLGADKIVHIKREIDELCESVKEQKSEIVKV